ncbi:hypothetical protein EON62_01800 [archaeon]|nr:MAG: hypothetical protein EON62_01800 [archaeon]
MRTCAPRRAASTHQPSTGSVDSPLQCAVGCWLFPCCLADASFKSEAPNCRARPRRLLRCCVPSTSSRAMVKHTPEQAAQLVELSKLSDVAWHALPVEEAFSYV